MVFEGFEEFSARLVDWVWSVPLFFMLLGCGLLFSILTKFPQWRILTHGYAAIRGHYDRPDDIGHINHFQALCAALSATIGLGNIAGVAVAVALGGPGSIFWMWVVGFFGMALKFMECSLAVMFRDVRDVPDPSAPAFMEADAESRTLEYQGQEPPVPGTLAKARGEVRGGPMWYIQKGIVNPLRARGNVLWVPFKFLAVLFSIAAVLNSFGGGNMFQGWNVADMLDKHFHVERYISASVVSVLVALVIIGGIRRIGKVASALVPFMCVLYVLGALYVIVMHASEIPYYLGMIIDAALTPTAKEGAFAGASVWIAFTWGLRRACFSNEAGEGSAAMAHAVAKTDEPVREGVVAGLEPFVDTIIICTMTGLVVLMTGTWNRPPVGTIAAIENGRAVVQCEGELPDEMEMLYLRRLQTEQSRTLAVHVVRDVQKDLKVVPLPIADLVLSGDTGRWSDVRSVVLSMEEATADPKDLALVEIGQQVHLDIEGAEMTGFAFDTTFEGFGRYMVTLAVCLFAFSTMISWSYYGEKGAEYLLGPRAILPYKFVFVVFVFLGMVLERFNTVYNFSDATTGMMVICNLPAVLVLSPVMVRATRSYFRRLNAGEMPMYK